MYGSDPFSYHFEHALAAAKTIERAEGDGLSAEQRYWRREFPSAPSAEQLRRHAARFGAEGINETGAAYGIDLGRKIRDETKPSRQRRSSAQLRAEVIELHSRGVLPEAIADTLNVSDRRVKALLLGQAA